MENYQYILKKYILFVLRLMSCIILLTEIKGVNF